MKLLLFNSFNKIYLFLLVFPYPQSFLVLVPLHPTHTPFRCFPLQAFPTHLLEPLPSPSLPLCAPLLSLCLFIFHSFLYLLKPVVFSIIYFLNALKPQKFSSLPPWHLALTLPFPFPVVLPCSVSLPLSLPQLLWVALFPPHHPFQMYSFSIFYFILYAIL